MAAINPAQRQPDPYAAALATAKREALSMAVEDIYGPWELRWRLESEFPGAGQDVIQMAARDALRELLREGLLKLVRWDPTTGARAELTRAEGDHALADPTAWTPIGEQRPHVRFTATPSGERVYFSSPVSA